MRLRSCRRPAVDRREVRLRTCSAHKCLAMEYDRADMLGLRPGARSTFELRCRPTQVGIRCVSVCRSATRRDRLLPVYGRVARRAVPLSACLPDDRNAYLPCRGMASDRQTASERGRAPGRARNRAHWSFGCFGLCRPTACRCWTRQRIEIASLSGARSYASYGGPSRTINDARRVLNSAFAWRTQRFTGCEMSGLPRPKRHPPSQAKNGFPVAHVERACAGAWLRQHQRGRTRKLFEAMKLVSI